MNAKYLGPSDIFAIGGREYKRGDTIPNISREVLMHHMYPRGSHYFEVDIKDAGVEQPATLAEANTERGEVPKSVTDAGMTTAAASAGIGVAVTPDAPATKPADADKKP